MGKKTTQLDSKDSIFFESQLRQIMPKIYDKIYPELKMASGALIPVTSEINPGAESALYRMYDKVGVATIVANYADDLPVSDVKGTEQVVKVKTLGAAFQYNWTELKNARFAGVNLETLKAISARSSIENLIEKLAWYGDANFNIVGWFNNPNFPVTVNSGKKITDPTATAQEMYDVLAGMVQAQLDLTNGKEIADTLVLPVKQFGIVSTKLMGANADYSVLEVFKRNHPQITKVEWASQLKNVTPRPSGNSGATDIAMLYRRDPEKVRLEIPLHLEQLPPDNRNLAIIVNMLSRFAGIISNYPLSVSLWEEV